MARNTEREVEKLQMFKRQLEGEIERLPEGHSRKPIAEVELLFVSQRLSTIGKYMENLSRLGSILR